MSCFECAWPENCHDCSENPPSKIKISIIVTRHEALLEYLIAEGLTTPETKVISHATPEQIRGKHVAGVLPHSLSCLTASFTEIPLFLPPELRGKELTLEQVKDYAQEPRTYTIKEK